MESIGGNWRVTRAMAGRLVPPAAPLSYTRRVRQRCPDEDTSATSTFNRAETTAQCRRRRRGAGRRLLRGGIVCTLGSMRRERVDCESQPLGAPRWRGRHAKVDAQAMEAFICMTCGAQFAATPEPPTRCPICDDERQYVGHGGQRWTTQ